MKSFLWPFSPYRRLKLGRKKSSLLLHSVLVNRLGLSQSRNRLVRLPDQRDMTIVVDWDVKPQNRQVRVI